MNDARKMIDVSEERNGKLVYVRCLVLGLGVKNDEGKRYAHLAVEGQGTQQKNGFVPVQFHDWIDEDDIFNKE